MSRYVVIGGFLGSGKTTLMIALSKYYRSIGINASLIINDLGSSTLVDAMYSSDQGCITRQINDDCICYKPDELLETLKELRDTQHSDLIISDIPGCGIGALEHVYRSINTYHKREVDLCPFVSVCDPERLKAILPNKEDIHLPEEIEFLFFAQLKEAEVIVLNKTDLISEEDLSMYVEFLHDICPGKPVFPLSAKNETGIIEFASYLLENDSNVPVVDIGYGSIEHEMADSKLTWYDQELTISSMKEFDANEFVSYLFECIRKQLIDNKANVPHLKIYLIDDNNRKLKASMTGIDYPVDYDEAIDGLSKRLNVIINARCACELDSFKVLMQRSINETLTYYSFGKKIFIQIQQ